MKFRGRWASLMVAFIIPIAGNAADYTYTINNGSVTITGYTGTGRNVVIPSSLGGRVVTTIGEYAFTSRLSYNDGSGPTNIIIPNSVTMIQKNAFYKSVNLDRVFIGSGVTSIGKEAFLSYAPTGPSHAISYIDVHASNTVYSSLDGILLNKNKTSIICWPAGKGGHYIPSGVTSIGDSAFAHCGMSSMIIPDGVVSIGADAFSNCGSLGVGPVIIGNSVTNIGPGAFWNCGNLSNIVIPDSAKSIGENAFWNCTTLTSVTLGNGLASIGRGAFVNCTQLRRITFPKSVTRIESQAFNNCINLENFYFKGDPPILGNDMSTFAYKTTVYYLPETEGWTNPWGGLPSVLWNPKIQHAQSFGWQSGQFEFSVIGSNDYIVTVEACTNLTDGIWNRIRFGTLSNGVLSFSDPQSTNYPGRFYRLRMP